MKQPEIKVNFNGRSLVYTDAEIESVVDVMRNAPGLTQGTQLNRFEEAFGDYHGFKNCFATSTAATALELCAILARVGPGDEVIVPAHTYCASAIPFGRAGAKLVWADLDPKTFVISAESVRKLITPATKALVVVHLYGLPAEMDEIAAIAREHNIVLIEDCAQALGAEYRGQKVGTWADLSVWSFQSQKNITTLGEGGMLRVKSEATAAIVPGLRHNGHAGFGEREHYWLPAMSNIDEDLEEVWPYNFCLSEAQCALGVELLKRVDEINAARGALAEQIRSELSDCSELCFQEVPEHCKSAWHLLPARFSGGENVTRDDFISLMAYEFGVKVIIQYYPLYRYDLFRKKGFGAADCPETDAFFDSMVSFPFDLWRANGQVDELVAATRKAIAQIKLKS